MGKIKQGILGGFSGKVANVVGSSWKGIAVMKSLPLSVANPRTAKQVAQRGDFSDTIALGSLLLSGWVKPLWDRWASKMSGFNAFCGTNIERVLNGENDTYKNFVMSSGKMAATIPSVIDITQGESLAMIEWPNDSGDGLKLSDDIAYGVMFGNDLSNILKATAPAVRSDLSLEFDLPSSVVAGDVFNVALAFLRADGTVVSDSSVIQVVAQA